MFNSIHSRLDVEFRSPPPTPIPNATMSYSSTINSETNSAKLFDINHNEAMNRIVNSLTTSLSNITTFNESKIVLDKLIQRSAEVGVALLQLQLNQQVCQICAKSNIASMKVMPCNFHSICIYCTQSIVNSKLSCIEENEDVIEMKCPFCSSTKIVTSNLKQLNFANAIEINNNIETRELAHLLINNTPKTPDELIQHLICSCGHESKLIQDHHKHLTECIRNRYTCRRLHNDNTLCGMEYDFSNDLHSWMDCYTYSCFECVEISGCQTDMNKRQYSQHQRNVVGKLKTNQCARFVHNNAIPLILIVLIVIY